MCPKGIQCITIGSYSRIAHCDLRGPGVTSYGYSIVNSGATDVAIEDNIIEQGSDVGINTGGGSLRWTIRNNLVQNNAGDGIFLASGTSDSVVADNIVVNNGSNGIDCNGSGNTFHGNVSNSNGRPGGNIDRNGILISGIANGSSADHNSLVGNETNYNGGSGINIRADAGTTANYNIVSGNVSHDNSGLGNADGISVDGSDRLGTWIGNAIVGNTVYHNQRFGIMIDGENATSIQNTVISSNVAVGNGNTGIIAASPKVQDTLIVNNLAIGNGSAQINDSGTTRAIIAGNKENATDSSYVIKNDLVANTITSRGPNLTFQTSAGILGGSMTDAGMWSFSGGMTIGGGISNDGTGLKHRSASTGIVAPGGSTVVTLTWSTPFNDANYDPQCSVVDPATGSAAIRIHHIQSFTAVGVAVQIVNDDVRSFHQGTLYCLGIHRASSDSASSPSLKLGVVSGSSNWAAVQQGGIATYSLSIGGGGIGGTVSLSCTGAPPAATCLVPDNQNVNAAVPAVFSVRVKTTSPSAGLFHPSPFIPSVWFWGSTLVGLAVLPNAGRAGFPALRLIRNVPLALLLLLCACGISGASKPNPNSTPPGTYNLSVTAVSGSMTQSTSLVLAVQ